MEIVRRKSCTGVPDAAFSNSIATAFLFRRRPWRYRYDLARMRPPGGCSVSRCSHNKSWDEVEQGSLHFVRDQGTVHQNLLIALSGPLMNLLLVASGAWFPVFGLANLCYALANTLPIEGSDGMRIAASWRRIHRGELAN
jgi:hypothetical protein